MRFGKFSKSWLGIQEGQLKCPRCFIDIIWDEGGSRTPRPEDKGGEEKHEDGERDEDCYKKVFKDRSVVGLDNGLGLPVWESNRRTRFVGQAEGSN
jgi:hypothetical protein